MTLPREEAGEASGDVGHSRPGSAAPSSSLGSDDLSSPHFSPPPPPPDFNPPADFPQDSPTYSITSPTYSASSPPRFSGQAFYPPLEPVTSRPGLPSIHRLSTESVPTPGSGTSSQSSTQSEGGEHLVEMRERLLSESSTASTATSTPSNTRSRAGSQSQAQPGYEAFRSNLIQPTPPTEPVFDDIAEDDFDEPGPSRHRRLSSGVLAALEDNADVPVEHAWDSVWPTPGSNHRPPDRFDSGPSRFPIIAPVSPFVTPSFSPAVISTQSSSASGLVRKPPSPSSDPYDPASPSRGSSQSPGPTGGFRFSPRGEVVSPSHEGPHSHLREEMFYAGRRQSITADTFSLAHSPPTVSPISINTGSRHNRSLSSSSQHSPQGRLAFDKLHRGSPTLSPPRSPRKAAVNIPPVDTAARPTSPPPPLSRFAKASQIPPSSAPPTRLTNPGASPPLSALARTRPRGQSLSSVRGSQPFALEPPEGHAVRAPSPLAGLGVSGALSGPSPRASPRASPRPSPRTSPRLDSHRAPPGIHETISSLPPAALPPISLPPPVTQTVSDPLPTFPHPALPETHAPAARAPSPPLFAPLARPAVLRRAISDFDGKSQARASPPGFHRTLSITAELDKSPKRSEVVGELASEGEQGKARKSPRSSPLVGPFVSPLTALLGQDKVEQGETEAGEEAEEQGAESEETERGIDLGEASDPVEPPQDTPFEPEDAQTPWPESFSGQGDEYGGDVALIDDGDVLPSMEDMQQMDVTFDDEGLNTLERIFLLSKSEYPFHRAYVARVLGDLLHDVDPCESVEYVLPLLSGFSLDDDESVKEAFAEELHRILWYFYSTCKLQLEEVEVGEEGQGEGGDGDAVEQEWADEMEGLAHPGHQLGPSRAVSPLPMDEDDDGTRTERRPETITVSSAGVQFVPKPSSAEIAESTLIPNRQQSWGSNSTAGPSSSGSSRTRQGSSNVSPNDDSLDVGTPSSSVSEDTAYSPGMFIKPHTDDIEDVEAGLVKDQGILVDRPALAVGFFTPLIGSLLLNQNPQISECVRNGVVAVLGRLRGHGELTLETWGPNADQPEPDERRAFLTQNGPHQHDLRPFTAESKQLVENELLQNIIIGMGGLSTEMPDMMFDDVEGEDGVRDQEAFQAQLIQEATAGRATSVNLIGSVCQFYGSDEVVDFGFVEEVLASGDGDVLVRAEAAVAMSYLAKMVPVEQVYRMIPLFEAFCEDENDHVKQSACVSVPALCKRIESPEYQRAFAVKALQTLTGCDEDVRCAALEMLGEVIHIFHEHPTGPPAELLAIYVDDREVPEGLRDSDWDEVAIFNFPGVCLTLGPERWPELRDLFRRLQGRAGDKVLRTTASMLHELAKILDPDQVVEDLLPVYERLLDESEDIRERVYEHADVIVASVPTTYGWELFRNLAVGWKEGTLGGWRAREKLALHIPSFLKTFQGWEGVEEVLEMMRDALLDPFAAVRDAATHGIPRAYEVLGDGDTTIAHLFRSILLDLGSSPSFKQRLTFVRCLREFAKPPPNRTAFEEFFLPVLPRLAEDVVDIRLALAQIVADLFVVGAYYADVARGIPEMIRHLARGLARDEAVDVRDTVRRVDLDRIEKGKGVPYEVDPKRAPDRAAKPGDRSPTNAMSPGQGQGGAAAAASSAIANASGSRSRSSSAASGESGSSSSNNPSGASSVPSGVTTIATSTPASSSSPPQEITPKKLHSKPLTPTIQIRRPSTEVTSKLGGLQLSAPGSSSEDEETPRLTGKEFEDVDEHGEEGDPFEASFSRRALE
ncbi:hypothetical protein IAT38_007648 [Cryptococcus sp. DSM 104549]